MRNLRWVNQKGVLSGWLSGITGSDETTYQVTREDAKGWSVLASQGLLHACEGASREIGRRVTQVSTGLRSWRLDRWGAVEDSVIIPAADWLITFSFRADCISQIQMVVGSS